MLEFEVFGSDREKTAIAQIWVWIVGTIILVIGVGLADTGHAVGEPIAGVGSFIVLFDMLLFGWLVFRGERDDAGIHPMRTPAGNPG